MFKTVILLKYPAFNKWSIPNIFLASFSRIIITSGHRTEIENHLYIFSSVLYRIFHLLLLNRKSGWVFLFRTFHVLSLLLISTCFFCDTYVCTRLYVFFEIANCFQSHCTCQTIPTSSLSLLSISLLFLTLSLTLYLFVFLYLLLSLPR